MTKWVENPELGRERGPVGLLRAWVEILVRPRRFFHTKVTPGDQAPGVTFAAAVVLVAEAIRIAGFGGWYPVVGGEPTLSVVFWVLAVTVLIAPAGIHLVAAVQTLILVAAVEDRAGVGVTVQVLCYAFAPCILAGVPDVWVRSAVTLWGSGLLIVGLATVHDIRLPTALAVGAVPAALVFGYGFGGVEAVTSAGEVLYAELDALLAR
ncbi:MAG: YIP1 family protein [Haloarculaceae archaeon]